MIKSSIICVLQFLECLIANKYTYQIWDPNSHWESDFLSRVFLQWRSAITETKNVRAKGEGSDRGRPGCLWRHLIPRRWKKSSCWSFSSCKDALVAALSRTTATVSNPKEGISLHRQKSAVERIFRTCSENFNLKELCINFTSDCFERQVHVKGAART